MVNKRFLLGMLVMALVFGMTVVGCDNGTTGNNDPKTLVITMPETIYNYGANGFQIGVFPVGTTPDKAITRTGIVAGADESTPGQTTTGSDPKVLTIDLYNLSNNTKWTGSGTYDLYAVLTDSSHNDHYYKAGSVNISSATTNIQINNSNVITP